MTENKRFNIRKSEIIDGAYCIFDDIGKYAFTPQMYPKSLISTCKALNELNDENEQLRLDFKEMKGLLHLLEDEKELLEKDNKELKDIMNEVFELLSEEVDVFSDKATEHDINAYLELKELDNKDAYYMCTATKKAIKLLKKGGYLE